MSTCYSALLFSAMVVAAHSRNICRPPSQVQVDPYEKSERNLTQVSQPTALDSALFNILPSRYHLHACLHMPVCHAKTTNVAATAAVDEDGGGSLDQEEVSKLAEKMGQVRPSLWIGCEVHVR